MLRQVYILREGNILYEKNFGRTLTFENFQSIYQEIQQDVSRGLLEEFGSSYFFKYRIIYTVDMNTKTLFIFIVGFNDDIEQVKIELNKLKKEFIHTFGDSLESLDLSLLEMLNPTVESIHRNIKTKISLVGFSGVGKTTIATGLMGALADAVLAKGGYVIGVIPTFFNTDRLVHTNLSELHVVESMHIRKARMADLADGFIALPGGFGTLEELSEILTWAQIGLHRKPVGVLNVDGYYDPLMAFIEHAHAEVFLYTEHRRLLLADPSPQQLLETMQSFRTPENLSRWVDRSEA